jgi:hyperosmotically inducible protein
MHRQAIPKRPRRRRRAQHLQRKANRLLSKQVRTALAKVKGLDSGDIVVIAKGSVVTLGGSVPDASQMPLAVTAAQGVQGVTEVHNTLSIKARGL